MRAFAHTHYKPSGFCSEIIRAHLLVRLANVLGWILQADGQHMIHCHDLVGDLECHNEAEGSDGSEQTRCL